jgi:hypothetical protein
VLSPVWGLAIGLAFAPAGMVLPLVLLGGREMGPAIGALPVVAVALHGFALVASLIAAPGALLRRRHASLDRLIRTTRRHHVAVRDPQRPRPRRGQAGASRRRRHRPA